MAALIRCGLRKSLFFGQYFSGHTLYPQLKQVQKPLSFAKNVRCIASVPEEKRRLLIDIHSRIDQNVGISTEMFNKLISSIEEHGDITEHDVALLLHICSFGPFDSSSQNRLALTEMIWGRLDEMGVQPTSKLYNMKLKAYCTNDKSFTPLEELAAMKSLGINPDKVTYGFLIDGFCQNGDITGANHVLEAMNDAHLFIGISVFNSFVTGHLKAGSPEEAANVIETMRSRGLSPNTDTYYRFIQHYAREGDVEAVLKYASEAEKEGVSLDQVSLLKIYRYLLLNGQKDEATQILPRLIDRDVFRHNSMQSLCHIVAEGFPNEALSLYLSIPKGVTENTPVAAGSFLLKSMIINGHEAPDVVQIADQLLESNPSTTPHRYALLYAYKMDKHDLCVQLLEVLMSQQHDIKIPHILPAVCHYRDTKNKEGLYKAIDMILSIEYCDELFEVLDKFCYPALRQLNQSKEEILVNMQAHQEKLNTFFMIQDFRAGGFDAALQSVEGKSLDASLVSWFNNNRHLLPTHLPQQRESCVTLLSKLMKKNGLSRFCMMSIIKNRLSAKDFDTVNFMLDYLKQERVKFPESCLHFKNITEAPQEIQDKLTDLCRFSTYFEASSNLPMKELRELSKDQLEEYIKKKPSQTLARVALLKKDLHEKDLVEIQKRLRELQAVNFSFVKFQLVDIITVLAELGDMESASQYFKELREKFENKYIDTLPLTMAAKYVEMGNIEGALEMIQAAKESDLKSLPGKEITRKSKIAYILNKPNSVDVVETLHDALVKGGDYLTSEDVNRVHFNYSRKSLDSDDDKTVLKRLTRLRDKYMVFPNMDRVIQRFIKKQDIESLKEVMDLGVSIVGNNVFHHKLACNFIACGMPSKATSIFQKLGDRLNSRMLETACKYFIKTKKVEHVESLVEIVRTLPVSRAIMLKQLVEAYVSVNAMDKAFDVLHDFDNEFLVPHSSTLNFLAMTCKKNNMEQPEILKAFLSKREIVDQTSPNDLQSDSSSSESDSDSNSSSSDSDEEITEAKDNPSKGPDSSDNTTATETKTS